jgi:hypothetical protein
MERYRLMLGLVVCVMLTTAVQVYAQPQYMVTDLGALRPTAVINGPIVFGDLNGEPVVWQAGHVRALQHFGHGGQVNGANARGDSVGSVLVPGSDGQRRRVAAFWYPDGSLALLPGVGETEARGINMARTIAGSNRTDGHALRWSPEGREEYLQKPTDGFYSRYPALGVGVDRFDRVWGNIGPLHAYRVQVWDVDGRVLEPPQPSCDSTRLLSVSDEGTAIGECERYTGTFRAGSVTFTHGTKELPGLGGVTSACHGVAVNPQGTMGGYCSGAPNTSVNARAVLWPAAGGIHDLATEINIPGFRLTVVTGISADGHLVVTATQATSSISPFARGFLLTPQAQPLALALRLNQDAFRPGETLAVAVEVDGGPADLHVAIILPDQTSSRLCLPQCGLKPTVLDGRKSLDIHARPLTRSESR